MSSRIFPWRRTSQQQPPTAVTQHRSPFYPPLQNIVSDTAVLRPDPPAKYDNPNQVTPLTGRPLRSIYGHAGLGMEYREDCPRLVDISEFDALTNCSQLRTMDAIVTILHEYDPKALEEFLVPWKNGKIKPWEFVYLRRTCEVERLDLMIRREGKKIELRMFEKIRGPDGLMSYAGGSYIEGMWHYSVKDGSVDHKTWDVIYLEGKPWVYLGHYWENTTEQWNQRLEDTKKRDSRFARYLLLNRPWEYKPGVYVTVNLRHLAVMKPPSRKDQESADDEGNQEDGMDWCKDEEDEEEKSLELFEKGKSELP